MRARISRKYFSIIIVLIFIFNLASCEVEMEYYGASYLVSSAEAEVYKAGAESEEDVENISVSVASLDEEASPQRYKKILLIMDSTDFFGYQFLYCNFEITSSADALLTLECFSYIGDGGEIKNEGVFEYSLIGEESTEISLPIAVDFTEELPGYVALEIVFSSTSPLSEEAADGEQGTETEDLTFAEWSAITYKISKMLFYGVQTTAT